MAEKDSKNASSEWQLNGSHQSSVMMEQPSCSNANMIESFRPAIWDQLPGSDHLGFSDNTVRLNPDPYNALMNQACLGWTPPDAMLKGEMFLPGCPGFLPPSLAHFPADSGFIERAARYSCFSGGKLGEIVSPFSLPESVNPSALAPMLGVQSRNDNMNMVGSSNGVYVPAQCVVSDGNQFRNVKSNESLARSHDEVKGGVGVSSNASDEVSGQGAQEKPEALGRESSSKAHGSKKRKRCGQQVVEVRKDNNGVQRIGPQNPTSITNKPGGKNAKQGPEASDLPKEEYIHVRARRGQATNSHSLAERVRREKISERMKFLQELVPSCSKVTGKAVMLDEIINYVQSLQRQVEFLSMKLATVNPRLDFNIEELHAKDSQAGPSAQAFSPDISTPYPPLHQ